MMWLLVPGWCAVLAWLKTLDYGDVPTWFSALGGIGALIAATVAARASLAVLKVETERDNDADERAQRAQADLVAVWLDRDKGDIPWHLIIANESKVPVYALRVVIVLGSATHGDEKRITRYLPVVRPGGKASRLPGLVKDLKARFPEEEAKNFNWIANVLDVCEVWVTFRDAAGVVWTRSSTGYLSHGVHGPFVPDGSMDDTETDRANELPPGAPNATLAGLDVEDEG